MLALLYTQGLGFVHDIFHAGWAETPQQQARSAALFNHVEHHGDEHCDEQGNQSSHHDDDCDAFDAAAIAATIHIVIPSLPVIPSAYVLALWVAFASRDIPFLRRFSTRAPPL
ncbi:hypothetical protein RGU70_03430 [Herbaspirillum sp. RTI4]|uniref:hypothetical protein n=1 Tax=Herbaspirillum sp. RTI4 TaxID=3048640 RepID=UPI002AB473E0|nr:hypothetical protein [Herbaspirillum sp. RTI4]MDY7577379.1 hypothetical protein [Herbaspirillum sp. RTI4]MEA9982393.1 hypothetical protein [Herbaspirillum sp. RTI4]